MSGSGEAVRPAQATQELEALREERETSASYRIGEALPTSSRLAEDPGHTERPQTASLSQTKSFMRALPKLAIAGLLVGMVFSFLLDYGARVDSSLEFDLVLDISKTHIVLQGLVLGALCLAAFVAIYLAGNTLATRRQSPGSPASRGAHAAPAARQDQDTGRRNPADAASRTRLARRLMLAVAAVWVFWFAVLFPGVFAYDGGAWYEMWDAPTRALTTQWSLFYSFAYHGFLSVSHNMFGSYVPGFSAFMALQAALVLLAAYLVLSYIAQRTQGPVAPCLTAIFFAFVPPIPILAFSSATDTPFMALVAIAFVSLLRSIDDPETYWARPHNWLVLCASILAMCMVRNNGLFAMVLFLPFGLLLYTRGYRKQLAAACIVPLVVFFAVQNAFAYATGAERPSLLKEAGNVPMFQLERVYLLHKDELGDQEKAMIERCFGADVLERERIYPSISDGLKLALDIDYAQSNLPSLARLYISIGMRYPHDYLDAFMLGSAGLWYPFKHYPDPRMFHAWLAPECETAGYLLEPGDAIPDMSLVPAVDDQLSYYYLRESEHFSEHPVLALFSKSGPYFFLLIFVTAYCIAVNRRPYTAALALFWALLATVALGPVVLFRYIAPVVFCAPLLLTLFQRDRRR